MRMMDLAPWSRSSIGFDRLFDMLENARRSDHADNYPPYNIEKTSDDTYRITLAVAGCSRSTASNSNSVGVHSVCIGAHLGSWRNSCCTTILSDSQPRCTSRV